jgi:serine/threonine protein kinase/Tol biopolymer transport system component
MENSAMDAERWQNVERLYHATLECEESQRAVFLARACGGDEALRREVESLISYGNRAAGFIEGSALRIVAPALAGEEGDAQDPAENNSRIIGKRISQYRLVEQVGSGGMGEVYRAVRADDQFQKQVAIKLIRAGEDFGLVINRFKNERQILANLDHPNIARLLDGGATEEGVPYFVMELVEGHSIDKYCDSHKLGIPVRLQLFLQVCSAVQYSHQHQIIHRDIKPANILVTAEGVPKLLDFGIAKILESDALAGADGEVGKTQTRFRAFTPEYASPEQIKAEPISGASDVYSLGVLLYELLTGHRPYRFKTRTPAEIERAICEEEPVKPSTAVSRAEEQTVAYGTTSSITPEEISAVRDSDPKRMHNCLLGDLDAIVMMALRKEPHRRYASVVDLSGDIRKHLEGLPITARPSTIAYRGAKFLRRHRELAVAALVFLVLVLIGGVAIVRRWEVGKPRSGPQGDVVRRELTPDAPGHQVNGAAISRDGKYLAYGDTAGKMYLLKIDGGDLRQLPFSDLWPGDWFPDGTHLLGYGRGQHSGIWKISILDGSARKLADSACFGESFCAAVSPDGSHIAYIPDDRGNTQIWLMGRDGEAPHRIAAFDASDIVDSLAWSPSGQRLAYTRARGPSSTGEVVIETSDIQGDHRTLVLSDPRLWFISDLSEVSWLPDGRILYRLANPLSYRDCNIWAIATDPESGKPVSPPALLTTGVREAKSFGASADGKRFIYMPTHTNDAVYLGGLQLGAKMFSPQRLTLDEWNSVPSDWTRDSKAVLYYSIRSGRAVILKQQIDQQTPEILLSSAESYRWPVLSPTGDRLLYTAATTLEYQDPSTRVMSMPVNGGAGSVLLRGHYIYHCGSVPSAGCVVSHAQGQQIVFSILDPVKGKGTEIQRLVNPRATQDGLQWSLSPDGSKIAVAPIGSTGEVRILTLAAGKVATLALQRGQWKNEEVVDDWSVVWSADGSHLFATAESKMSNALFFVDPRGNLQLLAEAPPGVSSWLYFPRPSPDGHYLAYMMRTYENNVMMLEHF